MSIHKIGYSAESLQKDKIENLEKEFESQTKLFNIKHNAVQSTIVGVSDKLEKFITRSAFGNLQNTDLQIEEIEFANDETQIVVNAKLILDIKKSIVDIKINLKYLEQDNKKKLLEKEKEIISEAVKQANEQQIILRNHFERNILVKLEKCKKQAVKDTIQFL